MGMEDLAELAIKYDAPMSSSMNKKDLAREVYRAYGAHAAAEMHFLMEEENVWVDSGGMEHTLLSGQSFMQMDGVDKLLPSEIATDLLASDSAASAFAYAYRNPHTKAHNDILVALRQAGVNPDDVYGQLSSEFRNSSYVPLPRELKNVLNTFEGYTSGNNLGQDILGGMAGYFGGNDSSLMDEFTTPKELGGLQVQQAIESVAAAYVDRAGYASDDHYNHDLAKVSRRIQANLGSGVQSIATQIALEKSAGKDAYTSYADILPSSLDDKRLAGIAGAAIPDKVGLASVRKNMRGIAAVYGYGKASGNTAGVTGLGVAPKPDERVDTLNELMLIHGDEPDFMAEGGREAESALSVALREREERIDVPAGAAAFIGPMPASQQIIVPPTPQLQFSPELQVGKAPASTVTHNGVTFHSVNQNSPEWDMLRSEHITASMAGTLLGHNKHSEPIEAVFGALGFNPFGIENIHNQHFKRGHRLEEIGRAKYAAEFGVRVDQTGFVTNDLYPGLGVSPDGLVGNDGLVEFKAPAANRFFDPLSKPEYLDQVQMQMAITGRKWTDLTQVGSNYGADGKEYQWLGRVDRIHADPKWAEQNAEKLQTYGAMIQEGRSLLGSVEAGAMSKEEFIDVMSKAVAKGNVEGVELLKSRAVPAEGLLGGARRETYSPNYHYQGPRKSERSGDVVPYSGGGGSSIPPNWGEPNPAEDHFEEEDADFGLAMTKSEFDKTMRDAVSGDAFKQEKGALGKAADAVKSILASNAGGSGTAGLLKMISAVNPALAAGAAALVGTAQIASDGIDAMQDEFTSSANAGIFNVNAFTTSNQNLEAFGLNENQARGLTGGIGNAAATLAAGDPSAASRIVVGSRGLLTMTDIRNTTDPSQLVALAAQRAKQRGLSGQQFSGLMSMAGLDGAAVAYNATDATIASNQTRHDSIMSQADADIAAHAMSGLRDTQISLSPRYGALQTGEMLLTTGVIDNLAGSLQSGRTAILAGAHTAVEDINHTVIDAYNSGKSFSNELINALRLTESGGDHNATNPGSTAKGDMQVLNGTASNPGYGVVPARDNSIAERERVGRDYYQALLKNYGYDVPTALLAYHEGPRVVDSQIKADPTGWKNHITAEEESYLRSFNNHFKAGLNAVTAGANADYFANSKSAQPATKVDVNVNISGETAKASVAVDNKAVKRKDVRLSVGGNTHNITS